MAVDKEQPVFLTKDAADLCISAAKIVHSGQGVIDWGRRRHRGPRGEGGGGTTIIIEYGRVVKRVDRPLWIWDPDNLPANPEIPPVDSPRPANTLPNPEQWKNNLPENAIKAEEAPNLQFPLPGFPSSLVPPAAADFNFVDPPGIAQVGYPIIYGEVSVVVYVKVSLPTIEEMGGDPQTDTLPDWWSNLAWPIRYWEQIELQKDPNDLAPSPKPPALSLAAEYEIGDGLPHPHLIINPDWADDQSQTDPDSSGRPRFLPNEDKYVKEYWTNPNLVCLLTNMWVTGINKEIISASPITFRPTPFPPVIP